MGLIFRANEPYFERLNQEMQNMRAGDDFDQVIQKGFKQIEANYEKRILRTNKKSDWYYKTGKELASLKREFRRFKDWFVEHYPGYGRRRMASTDGLPPCDLGQ